MDKNKSGMSLYAFIASTTFAIAISVAGIVTMMLWSWWGLVLVGVGVGILTIVYNKVQIITALGAGTPKAVTRAIVLTPHIAL